MASKIQVGNRYGRLTVIAAQGRHRTCKCDCGNQSIVLACNLSTGNTTSCGCLRAEVEKVASLKHGATKSKRWTATYSTWHGIVQRCTNPKNPRWSDYGGRGITICDRWRDSFEAFKEDMGERPAGSSIERVDNEQGYAKGNCIWASQKTQNRNRRSNRLLTVNGESKSLAEWAEITGKPYFTLHARLRRGWSDERTILT